MATHALFPGMSATAEIKTRVERGALAVPIQAVTTREDTTASDGRDLKVVLFEHRDGLAIERPVRTGIQDDDYIQIVSGVEEGTSIIAGPYRAVSRELADSTKVRVRED
jgi:HlyD family secretion protein